MESQGTKVAVTGRSWKKVAVALLALWALLVGVLWVGFRFDEGPIWHADVVAARDAAWDLVTREPKVLVIGDPAEASAESAALERRLAGHGLHVRYTGDDTMSPWERRYVAVYWSIVGLVFEPPVG